MRQNCAAQIWNPTVANLTLMALGSSAPEILLSVIEIISNGFFTGDLGPSTIVGSASFNLLVITAICVVALPDGDKRVITEMSVFKTTGFFSIFAYIWLLIILMGPWSPNVVEIWEAVLTFLFFPILVLMAYSADRGWIKVAKVSPMPEVVSVGGVRLNPHDVSDILRKINSDQLSKEERAEIVGKLALQTMNKPSRAVLRMNAIRQLTAQKRKTPKLIGVSDRQKLLISAKSNSDLQPRAYFSDVNGEINTKFAFLESEKRATLGVMRNPAHGVMTVKWTTRDGTAKNGDDYEKSEGVLTFENNDVFKEIIVNLYDDDATEDDELFYVVLLEINFSDDATEIVKNYEDLGAGATAEVTIIDDDEPGEIGFVAETCNMTSTGTSLVTDADVGELTSPPRHNITMSVSEASGNALVKVRRMHGSTGDITCEYHTIDGTAHGGVDYEARQGRLRFKSCEIEKSVLIPIINTRSFEGAKEFTVELSNLEGPSRACLHANRCMSVVILPDKDTKELLNNVQKYVAENHKRYTELGSSSWSNQFREALLINGGDNGEDDNTAGSFAFIMHALTFPWKLLFAFVPPTCYCGGWACFILALIMIGVVTAFIGDLAALFGCQVGLPDSITAITFVALGTSLPDAFASKAAALSDDTADASIGNVTGSNSVNVFLGLGLPWSLASIYWSGGFASDKAKKKWHNRYGGRDNDGSGGSKGPKGARKIGEHTAMAFVVPAGDLAVTVLVFVICGLTCLGMLAYRRHVYGEMFISAICSRLRFDVAGAELGGPKKYAKIHAACLVVLWYLRLSCLPSVSADFHRRLVYIAVSCISTLGAVQ